MPRESEELNVVLNVRISQEDQDRLDALADPIPRSHVVRTALRLGLAQIEDDTALLFGEKKPSKKRKRKRTE